MYTIVTWSCDVGKGISCDITCYVDLDVNQTDRLDFHLPSVQDIATLHALLPGLSLVQSGLILCRGAIHVDVVNYIGVCTQTSPYYRRRVQVTSKVGVP